jgi:uncharacterized phage-associated protein
MIKFEFNEIKATHAAALFLKLSGGSVNYMKLIKLMYLADRKALQFIERSISTDNYSSMRHGPVLNNIFKIIKSNNVQSYWYKYISKPDNYNIRLINQPTFDELSEKEESIISEIHNEYKNKNEWEMVKICHSILKEWESPMPFSKSKPIDVENILKALNKTKEEIEIITDDVESIAFLRSIAS